MLSEAMNERLTRVGPGTPGGELLRRYWHPVCAASDLTEQEPKQRVRVLGEDLVLYRSRTGAYGLVGERCSHRGTSLYHGFVEPRGIRCAYHGWLYDETGRCLEQPFEPRADAFCRHARHTAYPIQKLAGLLFAYLGPEPAPLLPRWDVLVREDGRRRIVVGDVRCNWVQAQENTVDPTHFAFLHGEMARNQGLPDPAGYTRPFLAYGFQPFEWGLLTSWHWGDDERGMGDEHAGGNPLIFPNALAHAHGSTRWINWRVPADDTHTLIFSVELRRSPRGAAVPQPEDPPVVRVPPFRKGDDEYSLETIIAQDTMAWESQGAIADRSREHLGAGDRGIVMFRQLLFEQMDAVEAGRDPLGVIRDPARNVMIELPGLFVDADPAAAFVSGELVVGARAMDEGFDERHRVVRVPTSRHQMHQPQQGALHRPPGPGSACAGCAGL